MPRFSAPEIIIILIVLVLVFGASKLPSIASSLGKSLKIFKKEVTELRDDEPADRGPTGDREDRYDRERAERYERREEYRDRDRAEYRHRDDYRARDEYRDRPERDRYDRGEIPPRPEAFPDDRDEGRSAR